MFWCVLLVLFIDFWVLNLLLYFFFFCGYDLIRVVLKFFIYEIFIMVDLKCFGIGWMIIKNVNSEYLYYVLKVK